MIWNTIGRFVDHMSPVQAAAVGGAGTGISLSAAIVDPSAVSPWLHLATLGIGSLTGLASFVLVALKIAQQRQLMRDKP